MNKYPLDLEKCYELCREDYEKDGKEFDAVHQDFVRCTVELINDAYYCGFSDGAMTVKNNAEA